MQPIDPDHDPRREPSDGAPEAEASDRSRRAEAPDGAPSDADVRASEEALRALTERDAGPRVGSSPARAAFRADLRARFVSGDLASEAGDGASSEALGERDVLGEAADDALRAWDVAPPAAARERAREAFLRAGLEAGAAQPRRAPHAARPAGHSTRQARTGSRQAPAPATRQRLRLLVGAGATLAAAAALLVLARPAWLGLDGGDSPTGRGAEGGATVASAGWSLDLEGRDASEVLPLLRIDGEAVARLDAVTQRLADGGDLETLGVTVRLRRGEEFVMELGPATQVVVPGGEDAPYRVGRGAARFATGPEFAGGRLVVETPHVRTQVLGTVFGVDVGEGYSCVCCLEGEVWTVPLIEGREDYGIGPAATRIVTELGSPMDRMPLVASHAVPLRSLASYWG